MAGKGKIKGVSVKKQQAAFEKATREGFKNAVKLWQRVFAPGHFEPSARAKYHYRPRTASYEKRKKWEKGHNVPLVWSGDSRRTVKTRFATPTVRKNRKGGFFTIRLNLGVRLWGRQNELTETTAAEMDAMAEEAIKEIDKALASNKNNEEIRV